MFDKIDVFWKIVARVESAGSWFSKRALFCDYICWWFPISSSYRDLFGGNGDDELLVMEKKSFIVGRRQSDQVRSVMVHSEVDWNVEIVVC